MADGKTGKPKDKDATVAAREITITRVFDAPREMIWDAWTTLSKLCNGGGRGDSQAQFTKWMCGLAAFGRARCTARMGRTT